MLERLAKLAARSAQLRELAVEKQAGVLGSLGKWAVKNPLGAAGAALTVQGTAADAKTKSKEFQQGFKNHPMTSTPIPPG